MKDKDTVSPTYDLTRELRITGYGLEYARKEIIRPYEERIAELENRIETADNKVWKLEDENEALESRLSAANQYLEAQGMNVEF